MISKQPDWRKKRKRFNLWERAPIFCMAAAAILVVLLVITVFRVKKSAEHRKILANQETCLLYTSEYFEKSNTLMLNFACRADSDDLSHKTDEVDEAAWYTPEEARKAICHDSLAERFLLAWLGKREYYDPAVDTCQF